MNFLPVPSIKLFGGMYWVRGRSLIWTTVHVFFIPILTVNKWSGPNKRLSLAWYWKTGPYNTETFLASVVRSTWDRVQMLQNDSSLTAERAHTWELFFLLTLWVWEDQQWDTPAPCVRQYSATLVTSRRHNNSNQSHSLVSVLPNPMTNTR